MDQVRSSGGQVSGGSGGLSLLSRIHNFSCFLNLLIDLSFLSDSGRSFHILLVCHLYPLLVNLSLVSLVENRNRSYIELRRGGGFWPMGPALYRVIYVLTRVPNTVEQGKYL